VDRSTGRAGRLKEYYLSLVSTLSVLYAILLAVLAFGQVVGAGNSLRHFNPYMQMPQWAHRYIFPLLFTALMLVLAYHLWFKKRAALVVLASFIVVKAAFDLAGGTHTTEAIVSIAIAAFFLTAWSAFTVTPDPGHLRWAIIAAVIAVPALALYGSVGLYLGRREYRVPANVTSLLKNTWLIVVGRGTVHFAGRDLLFDYTLVIIAVVVIAYVLFMLFRPHRPPALPTWEEEEKVRRILETYGHDSLAYFNTRRGKSYFFLGDEAFLAYRVVGGMAVISADPAGPEELMPQLLVDFKAFSTRMGWRLSGIGQSDSTADVLKRIGVRTFVLGEESLVDVTSFSLEGRDTRKLRQSVAAMERKGISVEIMYNASIPSHMRHELHEMSREWRGDNLEAGFAMGLGRLLSASDPRCLLALAYDHDRKPLGFQYFAPMYPHDGYSLDVTRTKIGAPRPLSDFLISRTAQFLKHEGYRYMSLHFMPLCQYYREDSGHKPSVIWGLVAKLIDRYYPIISAYDYDRKFSPQWLKRYLIYPSYAEFLRSGFTVLAAEAARKLTRKPARMRSEKAAALEE
jgi:lysylphosphatidylglycerol synthetase-like protein (DUF2156 family)